MTTETKIEKLAFSVEETAQALGLSVPTINRLIKRNEIHSVKLGARRLIPRAALEKILEGK